MWIAGALLASCAPVPHWATYAPAYRGVVRDRRSLPVEGAVVTYRYRNALVIDRCMSGSDGSFELKPLKQFHYLVYLGSPGVVPFPIGLIYPPYPNSLTVSAGGKEKTYWIGPKTDATRQAGSSEMTDIPFRAGTGRAWLRPDARWIGDPPVVLTDRIEQPQRGGRQQVQTFPVLVPSIAQPVADPVLPGSRVAPGVGASRLAGSEQAAPSGD